MFRKMRTFFRRRLSVTAVAFVAAAAAVVTPVLPTEEATAQQRCPSVAVIAARGSGQNNQIYRTRYAGEAPWTSNGWEGETIRAFLRYSESRYRATHGGNSLMKDVEVLGMEPRYYPAIYPDYDIPSVAAPATLLQALGLAIQYAVPLFTMARQAGTDFMDSVNIGRTGVMALVNDYERASGCHPKYVLSGYSQGAMILLEHERELARRGKLAGVVYFGNPMTAARDAGTVGVANGGAGGMLGFLPFNTRTAGATRNKVNYCLPLDAVCDLSVQVLRAAAPTGGTHGQYFLRWNRWDDQVADSFGRFVDQVRYR